MGQVNITWVQDQQYVATDSTNHSVVVSSTANGTGMKPSDLLMVALGSCTAYDVVNILTKRRAWITGLNVTVSGEQESEPPWTFRKIHVHYQVSGVDLTEREVEHAIVLSEEKYCSVSATLKQAAEITFTYEIIDTRQPVES